MPGALAARSRGSRRTSSGKFAPPAERAQLRVVRVIVIEHDRTLIPVRGQKICRFPAHERWSPTARLIPIARPLDLDHIRPEIAQQHRTVGAGKRLGQLNHADPIQNGFHAPDYRAEAPVWKSERGEVCRLRPATQDTAGSVRSAQPFRRTGLQERQIPWSSSRGSRRA